MKRPFAFAGLAALVSACSDGYSPKANQLNLHFQMTQPEAIEALNTIGSRPHLGLEWRYQLKGDCALEVSTHGHVFKRVSESVALTGTDISLTETGERKLYAVSVTSPASEKGGEDKGALVLGYATWSDASQVKWLLNYLPKFCTPAPENGSR